MIRSTLVALAAALLGANVLASDAAPPTFNKDIAPIVFQNCTSCHRAGEVAPFELATYDDVKKRAKQIARVTSKRYMPPWKAEKGFGEFLDARVLTDAQIETFTKWAEAGAPEGNPADLPKPPTFTDGWQLGTPDMILKVAEPYTVPAEGRDIYRAFVVPMNLAEDTYVAAVEYRPSNRKVVHHAIFFLDANGAARKLDEKDPEPGYKSFGGPGVLPTGGLGGWAPGVTARRLPDGMARLAKKGSDLIIQTHFHPSGKPEVEQSTVGVYLAKKTPDRLVNQFFLGNRNIDIAPGEKNYKIDDTFTLPVDVELVGITPHAHLICKEMTASATLPDGSKKPLISIKDWDFNWQDQYQYAAPVKLPKGTVVEMAYRYDNSADNPNNPSHPPKRVKFGEQTTDEMGLLFISAVTSTPADAKKLQIEMILQRIKKGAKSGGKALQQLAAGVDKDGDGKFSAEEIREALKKRMEKE